MSNLLFKLDLDKQNRETQDWLLELYGNSRSFERGENAKNIFACTDDRRGSRVAEENAKIY